MEKALALTIAGMILSAALFGFFVVLAADWNAMVGHRVLKEVIRGTTTMFQPIWKWSPTLEHWIFAGYREVRVPWEHPVYETVMTPKVAGAQVFWIVAGFFFVLFAMFTILFADELGVLGIAKRMTIFWALVIIALGILLGFGVATGNVWLLAMAGGFIPIIALGLVITLIK